MPSDSAAHMKDLSRPILTNGQPTSLSSSSSRKPTRCPSKQQHRRTSADPKNVIKQYLIQYLVCRRSMSCGVIYIYIAYSTVSMCVFPFPRSRRLRRVPRRDILWLHRCVRARMCESVICNSLLNMIAFVCVGGGGACRNFLRRLLLLMERHYINMFF